jgi:hypothetical protein
MWRMTVLEAIICAPSVAMATKTVMDGARLSHVRVLVLKALKDSMGEWEETGGSGIGTIEIRKKGLLEALTRFLGIKMEIKNTKAVRDEMGPAEGEVSPRGLKMATMLCQPLEIERAMVISMWTEVEDGGRKSVKKR